MNQIVRGLCSLGLLCAFSSILHAQSFTPLGDLPGGTFGSQALGVSADGSVVVGNSNTTVNGGNVDAFRWESGVMVNLGNPGTHGSGARAVSADGTIIVGSTSDVFNNGYPVRWVNSVLELLHVPGGEFRRATVSAISADGSVIIGDHFDSETSGIKWMNGVSSLLPTFPGHVASNTYDVSGDGSVIVGAGLLTPNGRPFHAVRWSNGGASVQDIHPAGWDVSRALGVSTDGNVIVGFVEREMPFERKAFRWENGVLTVLESSITSAATDVSGDGSVIVGSSVSGEGAAIWTASTGWRGLMTILTDAGVDLHGFTILYPNASISDDGLAIVGFGANAASLTEGWLATLTVPPAVVISKPAGNELVRPDEPYEIQFTVPQTVTAVDLFLVERSQSSSGERIPIAEDVPAASGSFVWEVPENLLSPSTFIIAVDANDPMMEGVSARFRVRTPWRLHRIGGTSAEPEYEPIVVADHGWQFNQDPENIWPSSYWNRLENSYDNYRFGYDPFIEPIGDIRYDIEWFFNRTPEAFPPWQALVRAFGVEAMYATLEPIEFAGTGTLTHQVNLHGGDEWRARTADDNLAQRTYDGACYGISMGMMAAFGNPAAFGARWLPSTGATNLGDLELTDEVREAVHALFTYQYGYAQAIKSITDTDIEPVTPRDVLKQLKSRFESDARDLDRHINFLSAYTQTDGTTVHGGHAVVPLGLEQLEGEGQYAIVIFDPNNGPFATAIYVDSTANSWVHDNPAWHGDTGKGLYFAITADASLGPADASWPSVWTGTAPLARRHDGEIDILAVRVSGGNSGVSGLGGEVSYRDNVLTETLDGGLAQFPFTGNSSRPWGYFVPPGEYTVDLMPNPEGYSSLSTGLGRTRLGFERLGDLSTGGTADLLTVGTNTLGVTPGSSGPVQVRALVAVASAGATRTFTADSLEAEVGMDARMAALPDSSQFYLFSEGTTTYDLVLGQAGAGGRRSFYHADVEIPAGASHTIRPDWATLGDGPVLVDVDLDGDGDIDETLTFENEGYPIGAGATTRYVAPGGSDAANDCTNPASPCATVNHAVDQANAGDTLDIAAGTYLESGLVIEKNLHVVGNGSIIR